MHFGIRMPNVRNVWTKQEMSQPKDLPHIDLPHTDGVALAAGLLSTRIYGEDLPPMTLLIELDNCATDRATVILNKRHRKICDLFRREQATTRKVNALCPVGGMTFTLQ
jgi:hypothetical protein